MGEVSSGDFESLKNSLTTGPSSLSGEIGISTLKSGSSASFISMGLEDSAQRPDSSSLSSGRSSPIGREFKGLLMIEVVSAENVPPCTARPNKGGPPSPFVVTSFGRKSFKTKILQRDQFPAWRERVYM